MGAHQAYSVFVDALRPVLETALDAVVVIRGDGMIVAWNGVAEATFGWSGEEAVGNSMAELIVPERHRAAHIAGMERYLATGQPRILGQRIEIEAIGRDGAEFAVELSVSTAPFQTEELFVGFLRDISGRRTAEAQLERRAREAEILFRITSMAAASESFDEALHSCLEAIAELTGAAAGHALAVAHDELVSTSAWFESEPGVARELRAATEKVRFSRGRGLPGIILERGEPLWMRDSELDPNFMRKGLGFGAAFGLPVTSGGRIIGVLEFFTRSSAEPDPDLMLTARTLGEQVGRLLERKRTEERQRLLVAELNHRVKNTLAVVQGLAAQTFRGEAAETSALRAFESRLAALAAAHDLLTGADWQAASLREVIEKTGTGCGVTEGRMTIEGPDLLLDPRIAVSLSLALHELCTNAIKYGALSCDAGKVTLVWSVETKEGSERLLLQWSEEGGPPVSPPSRRGFGSRMIERALATELGGSAALEFHVSGVRCRIEAALPSRPTPPA